ncbi:MAG TPA: cryptochrome/photolyase family protein, partial [bacterium]|nr:cryptochrome/photolyase family protein [bacterium]
MVRRKKSVDSSKESVWILPDQLSLDISSLQGRSPNIPIVMVEFQDREGSVRMHKMRLVFLLSAMRHFRDRLISQGYRVDYYAADDPDEKRAALCREGYLACLKDYVKRNGIERLFVTEPNLFSLDEQIRNSLADCLKIAVELVPTNQFLVSRAQFRNWEQMQGELVMENFYRMMRQNLDILMDGSDPQGGRWNYDIENRVPPM